MDEIQYIDDPRGGRVPMTDAYGNLTVDAMFLYNKDMLSPTNKAMMDALLAEDEMARDALEGYALMDNAKEAKAAVASINSSLGAEKADTPTPVIKLDYRKLSAAAAVIILIGIGAFVGTRFIGQDQLAENTVQTAAEPEDKKVNASDQKTLQLEEEISEVSDMENLSESTAEPVEENRDMDKAEDGASVMIGSTEQPKQEAEQAAGNASFDITQVEEEKESDTKADRDELLDRLASLKQKKAEVSKPVDSETVVATTAANQIKPVESQAMVLMDDDMAADQEPEPVAMEMAETEEVYDARLANERARMEEVMEVADLNEVERSVSRQAKMREQSAAQAPSQSESETDKIIYSADQVDQTPRFPGGDLELFKFIEKRKIHPPNLEAQGVEGEVFVSFQIDANGNVTNVKPLRSDNAQMESDAIRVVRSMPKWQAAKKGGYPVAVKKTILIKYNLKDE